MVDVGDGTAVEEVCEQGVAGSGDGVGCVIHECLTEEADLRVCPGYLLYRRDVRVGPVQHVPRHYKNNHPKQSSN